MAIFPSKRVKVTEGLYIRRSNHFYYTDFGVRDGAERHYSGRRYINTGVPGTGFMERESESHSYHKFVREIVARQKPRYWRLLLGKEPSYEKELKRAKAALAAADDPLKRQILDSYKIGHKSNKFLVSVMSHYKNKISQLGHDMRSVELHVEDTCTEEQYEAYKQMVEAFSKVADCRRVWHANENTREVYQQVFFDLGIFDFIRSDNYLPMLRDSNGVNYYLLPTAMIVARDTVDFDIVPLKRLTIVCQELAIQETVEVISSRLGDAASMVRIPEMNQTWYFNHVRPIMHFVGAYEALQATL